MIKNILIDALDGYYCTVQNSNCILANIFIAFSLMTVTVASATFSITGIQSSRADDVIRLSTAPFRTSIPDKTAVYYNRRSSFVRLVTESMWILPMGLVTGNMPTYKTWNFCTSSVFGVGNSAKEDNKQVTLTKQCMCTHYYHACVCVCERGYPAAGRRVLCGFCPAEILRP